MFGVNISIKSVSLASKAGKAIYSPGEDEDYGELKKGILKSALKKILPVDASFSFSADGGFSFDYEVRYDYTRKKLKVIDRYTLQEYQDKTLFNMGGFISIKMDVKLKAKYRIKWHPFVSSAKISAKIEANAEISGGFMLQVRFTTHVLNPYYEWVLVFTGLKGEYYQKVTVKANNDDIYDSEPDQNEILVDTNPAQADNTPPVKEHFSILDKKEIVIKRVNL